MCIRDRNITVDREITVQLPVKMIYSISSPAFSGGDILIGRMSDETIWLSFGGGSLKFRVNGNKRLINTYAELAMINASEDDLAYSYLQESALDLLGSEDVTAHGLERRNWLPIGVDYMNSFTGNYDGGKKEISNLYVNRESEDYIGLFGSSVGTLGNICVVSGLVNGNNYVDVYKRQDLARSVGAQIRTGNTCQRNRPDGLLHRFNQYRKCVPRPDGRRCHLQIIQRHLPDGYLPIGRRDFG